MDEPLRDVGVTIREDITKIVGGRKYYLAERITDSGLQGFWVGEDWKNRMRESK